MDNNFTYYYLNLINDKDKIYKNLYYNEGALFRYYCIDDDDIKFIDYKNENLAVVLFSENLKTINVEIENDCNGNYISLIFESYNSEDDDTLRLSSKNIKNIFYDDKWLSFSVHYKSIEKINIFIIPIKCLSNNSLEKLLMEVII